VPFGGGEKIAFDVSDTSNGTVSDSELNNNQWHLAIGVYDGSLTSDNVKLYIDGNLQTTTYAKTGNIPDIPEPLAIGANVRPDGKSFYPYDYFIGSIDDVRIYNRALSTTEITELYNIPEPSTLFLLSLGAVMLRRKR
jgi:hypothetical protein